MSKDRLRWWLRWHRRQAAIGAVLLGLAAVGLVEVPRVVSPSPAAFVAPPVPTLPPEPPSSASTTTVSSTTVPPAAARTAPISVTSPSTTKKAPVRTLTTTVRTVPLGTTPLTTVPGPVATVPPTATTPTTAAPRPTTPPDPVLLDASALDVVRTVCTSWYALPRTQRLIPNVKAPWPDLTLPDDAAVLHLSGELLHNSSVVAVFNSSNLLQNLSSGLLGESSDMSYFSEYGIAGQIGLHTVMVENSCHAAGVQ